MNPSNKLTDEQRRERNRVAARKWRSKNGARWRAYNRELRRRHPERYRQYKISYFQTNIDRIRELRKLRYAKNRQGILERNKAWYLRNKDQVIRQKSQRERVRRLTDHSFRCMKLLRNRIIEVLKRQSASKSLRTRELVGCDRTFLVHWIESQFTDGMTWKNHGFDGWHIDHIQPCASFDLADPGEQKVCFHYTNLQPLWAKENQSKSDKCQYLNI